MAKKLAEPVLSQQMANSGRIRFSVAGVEFLLLGLPGRSEQQRRDIDIAGDALEDVVAIEAANSEVVLITSEMVSTGFSRAFEL